MEPEVLFTKKIQDFLKHSLESEDSLNDEETKLYVDNYSSHDTIPFRIIRKTYMRNKKTGDHE